LAKIEAEMDEVRKLMAKEREALAAKRAGETPAEAAVTEKSTADLVMENVDWAHKR
jgi:hypothetical protein